jgi:outer membrane lipoprotein-sorting protein
MDSFNLRNRVTYAARCFVIISAILATGCTRARTSPPLTIDQLTATTNSVRTFAAAVADNLPS